MAYKVAVLVNVEIVDGCGTDEHDIRAALHDALITHHDILSFTLHDMNACEDTIHAAQEGLIPGLQVGCQFKMTDE